MNFNIRLCYPDKLNISKKYFPTDHEIIWEMCRVMN